jgi:ribosome-binding factor A
MASENRQERVGALIREEIGQLLQRGVKDPRIGFCSVMHVRMSPDLRYANVYISVLGSDKEQRDTLVGLERSAGWIRREIGKRIRLRYTPQLRFFKDDTLEEVYHLEEVFKRIHEEDGDASPDDTEEGGAEGGDDPR